MNFNGDGFIIITFCLNFCKKLDLNEKGNIIRLLYS